MANNSALTDYLSIGEGSPRRSDPLTRELAAFAGLGRAASAAEVCLIGWQCEGGRGLVRSPAKDLRFDALDGAGFALLANQLKAREDGSVRIFRVSAGELASRLGVAAPAGLELAAAAGGAERASVIAILMTAPERPADKVEAALELVVRAGLGAITAAQTTSSRRFWRERAQALQAELAGVSRRSAQAEAERQQITDATGEAAKLRPKDLPAGIGRIVARIGPFDAWIVALSDGDALHVEAASPPWNPPPRTLKLPLDAKSAIFDSFSRATPVSRLTAAPPGAPYREDRLFAQNGFCSYSCIPFETGVIVLGARGPIKPDAQRRADALVARIAPMVDAWNLRRNAQSQRDLVQNLALRLYGAVDSERARIARDLHDDQAQLMAATRIALEAPREKARRLLREIEQTLRAKLRGLRPASLGRATLKTALEGEIRRLSDAGIRARLGILDGAPRLPRPLQNVCYQIAREAVSNIIRHSRAHQVELMLELAAGQARLSITDDGKGMRKRGQDLGLERGGGLSGLAERVELIGGRLKIESRRGRTCVAAEFRSLSLSGHARGTKRDGR